MFAVLVSLTNLDGALKPGMNGEAVMEVLRKDNVLAIPSEAVRSMRDASTVAPALGLTPEAIRSATQASFAGRTGGQGGAAGGRGDSAARARRRAERAGGDSAGGGGSRRRVASGGAGGFAASGTPSGFQGGGGGSGGAAPAAGGAAPCESAPR